MAAKTRPGKGSLVGLAVLAGAAAVGVGLLRARSTSAHDPWYRNQGIITYIDPAKGMPRHEPPFNCQELYSMACYAEYLQLQASKAPDANIAWNSRWLYFYRACKEAILRACDADHPLVPPSVPPDAPSAPTDPIIDAPF